MKRYNAGLYLRLSMEDAVNQQKRGKGNPFQSESTSIENQRILLSEYAGIQGWNVAQIYSDDGFSGGTFDNRPAFQRMIRDAESGLINLVLVKDLSRFGRDYIETGRYTDEVFPALGVRFVALMDNIDSDGKDDLLPFRSILNDYHLRDLSRKVKSVLMAKAEKGEYIGTWAPYGFEKDPACKNRLIIDEYAAGVVRRIFEMRVHGCGYNKIAATLNNEGILSPRTYYYQKVGAAKPAKAWRYSVVSDILANEAYIGHAVRFKTGTVSYRDRLVVNRPDDEWIRCENVFPRIISTDVWEAVRELGKQRRKNTSEKKGRSLFAGLLKCADCGCALVHKGYSFTSSVTGEKHTGHHYICAQHQHSGGSTCSSHTIPEIALLTIIREDVMKQLEAFRIDEGSIAREVQKQFAGASLEEVRRQREELAIKLESISGIGKKLYEDRLKGIISVETFKSLYDEAEKDKADENEKLMRISGIMAEMERRAKGTEDIIPMLQEFLSLEVVNNKTLSAIIDHILVGESDSRKRNRTHHIKIVYRFQSTGF